jgi:hypothetical protein
MKKFILALLGLLFVTSLLARDETITMTNVRLSEHKTPNDQILTPNRVQFIKRQGRLSYVITYPQGRGMPNNGTFTRLRYRAKKELGTQMTTPNRYIQYKNNQINLSLLGPSDGVRGKPGLIRIHISSKWRYPEINNEVRPSQDAALARLEVDTYSRSLHDCIRDFQKEKSDMTINLATKGYRFEWSCFYK